jgi:hypothetical protein
VFVSNVNDHVRKSNRANLEVHSEFGQNRILVRRQANIQCLRKIERNLPVCPRASGHHENAAPIKFVTFLLSLDPGQKRLFIHADRRLNIHLLILAAFSHRKKGRGLRRAPLT